MRRTRPTERTLLATLDPSKGGVPSGSAEQIADLLRRQGFAADEVETREALEALAKRGRVEGVATEDGDRVYTRPDILLQAAGVTSVFSRHDRR